MGGEEIFPSLPRREIKTMRGLTTRLHHLGALLVLLVGAVVAALVLALVMPMGAKPAEAAFPGTNGKIAFVSDRNDPNAGTENSTACEVFMMDPNDSNQTNLTNDTTKCDESPTFSPNGSKIAFNSYDGNDAEIYVMDANGSNRTQLTNNDVDYNPPAFSRDGKKITFASTLDGGADAEIYVMDASDTDGDGVGDHLTQLTDNSAQDTYPVFSPSPRENKIAFVSDRGGNWDLYLMDARGSNPTLITNDALVEELPNFSPDGTEIAYDVFGDSGVGTDDSDIYVVDTGGTGTPTDLTNTPTTWEDKPAFSPDGTKIVFRHHVGPFPGDNEIYVMNSNGSGTPTNLTNHAGSDWMPDWGIAVSPTVLGTNPANAATGVERNTDVSATFSEEMDSSTVNTSTFKLYQWNKKKSKWVPVNSTSTTVSYDPLSKTATLDPYGELTALLAANRKYKAVVTTGAKDTNGIALTNDLAWTFTTGSS
jgi:Tol biopolymer transport system component